MKLPFKPTVCIYHGNCNDGFSSAWVLWKHFSGIEFFEGMYEKDRDNLPLWLSRVKGKKVLIVDFSFDLVMLDKLKEASDELFLLDHHKSAQKALGGLPYCFFDMNKSGAYLAWEACSDLPVPPLIEYVSDHDLWKHELPFSHEIAIAMGHKPRNFGEWQNLHLMMQEKAGKDALAQEGRHVLDYVKHISKDLQKKATIWTLGGQKVLAVNGVAPIANELCETLCDSYEGPTAVYEINANFVKFSLRSRGNIDVSQIAESYVGGGGHKNAAAFSVPVQKVNWLKKEV